MIRENFDKIYKELYNGDLLPNYVVNLLLGMYTIGYGDGFFEADSTIRKDAIDIALIKLDILKKHVNEEVKKISIRDMNEKDVANGNNR